MNATTPGIDLTDIQKNRSAGRRYGHSPSACLEPIVGKRFLAVHVIVADQIEFWFRCSSTPPGGGKISAAIRCWMTDG